MLNGKQQSRLDGRNPFSWWNATTLTTWILDIAQLEKGPREAQEEGGGGRDPCLNCLALFHLGIWILPVFSVSAPSLI